MEHGAVGYGSGKIERGIEEKDRRISRAEGAEPQIGLAVKQQVFIPLVFEDIYIDKGFYADMIVEERVIVELKSVEKIVPIHTKQLLTYLRLTNKKLGLLLNFGEV